MPFENDDGKMTKFIANYQARTIQILTPLYRIDANVCCKQIEATNTLYLRQLVLWPDLTIEQVQLPEDANGYHIGAFLPSRHEPAAVLSLFVEDIPEDSASLNATTSTGKGISVRFRKLACEPDLRNRGIGSKLLEHAASVACTQFGASVLWCDARTSSTQWYVKRGLSPFGRNFHKNGVEYVRMKKNISFPELQSASGGL